MEDNEEEGEEEEQLKKKRTVKKDTREWSMLLRLERGDDAGFDDEEIKHQVYLEAKKVMKQSGLCNTQAEEHTGRSSFVEAEGQVGLVGLGRRRDSNSDLSLSSVGKLWMCLPAPAY
jgi:hypothetical protein